MARLRTVTAENLGFIALAVKKHKEENSEVPTVEQLKEAHPNYSAVIDAFSQIAVDFAGPSEIGELPRAEMS